MTQRHQWKTGRQYDEHGQRMVAVMDLDNCRLLFGDNSRQIFGEIPLARSGMRDFYKYEIENLVMINYDLGNYVHSDEYLILTWED